MFLQLTCSFILPSLSKQSFVRPDTKFWPSVGRVDDVFGDQNLKCSCPPVETYCSDSDAEPIYQQDQQA